MSENENSKILTDEMINEYRLNRSYDRQLDTIMNMMFGHDEDRLGNSFGITLVANGASIHGTAVNGAEWRKEFLQSIESSQGGETLAASLREIDKGVEEGLASHREELDTKNEQLLADGRHYIHLKEVTVSAGAITTNHKQFRVRLDSVDGWSLS